jgi:uncharacterized protein (DUF58 family)
MKNTRYYSLSIVNYQLSIVKRLWREWRRALFGTWIVLCGVAGAIVTIVARRAEAHELARISALLSLAFVLLMLVFVVPPLVRAARAEIGRSESGVRVTLGGAIFLGLIATVAFAAWNTGNNLLFLVFSMLVSALFVSWATGRAMLSAIAVAARFPDHIFARDVAGVFVTLRNEKRALPSISISVEANIVSGKEDSSKRNARRKRRVKESGAPNIHKRPLAYFMYVARRGQVEQRIETVFASRGPVRIGGFEISTRFPFGFFRFHRRLQTRPVELIVYPKPEPANDELHLLPMSAGRLSSARRGQSYELHGLRDYKTQDDLRHIDWKATARIRRLTVREFTAEDERRVHIMFDTAQHYGSNEEGKTYNEAKKKFHEQFERGVTLAASLVAHFTDEKAEIILTLGEDRGARGTGREHFYDCLRRLALVAPEAKVQANAKEQENPAASFHDSKPAPPDADDYRILLTTAPPGTIPAHIWRTSHVIYL